MSNNTAVDEDRNMVSDVIALLVTRSTDVLWFVSLLSSAMIALDKR